MIAARIGPTGQVKPPSAAPVAEAIGSDAGCATAELSAGSPVVGLTATAARRVAPRACRLVAAAAAHVNGSATEPLPAPVDAAELRLTALTDAAAAVRAGRAAAGLGVAGDPADRAPVTLRCAAPRVDDGDDVEDAELTLDPAASVLSAKAAGAEANNPPIPNATARAPTRPT